jgi:hypothetical protein
MPDSTPPEGCHISSCQTIILLYPQRRPFMNETKGILQEISGGGLQIYPFSAEIAAERMLITE